MSNPHKIQFIKAENKYQHEDGDTKIKTTITGLPPQASGKAVKARARAMGLKLNRGQN